MSQHLPGTVAMNQGDLHRMVAMNQEGLHRTVAMNQEGLHRTVAMNQEGLHRMVAMNQEDLHRTVATNQDLGIPAMRGDQVFISLKFYGQLFVQKCLGCSYVLTVWLLNFLYKGNRYTSCS